MDAQDDAQRHQRVAEKRARERRCRQHLGAPRDAGMQQVALLVRVIDARQRSSLPLKKAEAIAAVHGAKRRDMQHLARLEYSFQVRPPQ